MLIHKPQNNIHEYDAPVENSGCEEPALDSKALLACHLSNHFQRAADEEGEVYPMSWQNCYGEEYQHVNSASWKFLECFQ